jgi:plasmid maintenance system antidote protein VapI
LLRISRQHLHETLEEKKPVSPNAAARIGKLIDNGAAIWLRLQALTMPGMQSERWT